ncbi:hypothetical protein BJX62DRAFT_210985 [Aspergillus germanicus]
MVATVLEGATWRLPQGRSDGRRHGCSWLLTAPGSLLAFWVITYRPNLEGKPSHTILSIDYHFLGSHRYDGIKPYRVLEASSSVFV